MEWIKLNDGTVLEIQSGCTEHTICVLTDSVDNLISNFTDENLERFEILNESYEVTAIYTKKHLKNFSAELVENAYLVSIYFSDIDEIYERISALEKTIETLMSKKEETAEETVEIDIIEEE